MEEEEEEGPAQGSPPRLALTELNNSLGTPVKTIDADEMIIVQRGPWKKPIVWSPVDYDRLLDPPVRERAPPEPLPGKLTLNRRLRRRLVMSPSKVTSQDVGAVLARKLHMAKVSRPVF